MHSSIVIIVIAVLFTSAISLYLPSMDVRRSMWPCLVTGLPGKEYWDVRRCRPTQRSTRKIMRKRSLYFNRDGVTGFHLLNIDCRIEYGEKQLRKIGNTPRSILFSLVFLLSRERQVQKAAEDTQLFVSQINIAFRWEDISLYVSVLASVLVCPRNQILLVPTQIIAFLHCRKSLQSISKYL